MNKVKNQRLYKSIVLDLHNELYAIKYMKEVLHGRNPIMK